MQGFACHRPRMSREPSYLVEYKTSMMRSREARRLYADGGAPLPEEATPMTVA